MISSLLRYHITCERIRTQAFNMISLTVHDVVWVLNESWRLHGTHVWIESVCTWGIYIQIRWRVGDDVWAHQDIHLYTYRTYIHTAHNTCIDTDVCTYIHTRMVDLFTGWDDINPGRRDTSVLLQISIRNTTADDDGVTSCIYLHRIATSAVTTTTTTTATKWIMQAEKYDCSIGSYKDYWIVTSFVSDGL